MQCLVEKRKRKAGKLPFLPGRRKRRLVLAELCLSKEFNCSKNLSVSFPLSLFILSYSMPVSVSQHWDNLRCKWENCYLQPKTSCSLFFANELISSVAAVWLCVPVYMCMCVLNRLFAWPSIAHCSSMCVDCFCPLPLIICVTLLSCSEKIVVQSQLL